MESKNANGYSASSVPLLLVCAYKPSAPPTVASLNVGDYVKIIWDEPDANGSPITGYRVFIQ